MVRRLAKVTVLTRNTDGSSVLALAAVKAIDGTTIFIPIHYYKKDNVAKRISTFQMDLVCRTEQRQSPKSPDRKKAKSKHVSFVDEHSAVRQVAEI